MHFENKLMSGVLVKRYKRFLADVRLSSGEQVTIQESRPISKIKSWIIYDPKLEGSK